MKSFSSFHSEELEEKTIPTFDLIDAIINMFFYAQGLSLRRLQITDLPSSQEIEEKPAEYIRYAKDRVNKKNSKK